jgi:hypothetical protein
MKLSWLDFSLPKKNTKKLRVQLVNFVGKQFLLGLRGSTILAALGDLPEYIGNHGIVLAGFELLFHAPKRYTDDVTMVQLVTGVLLAEFQPQLVGHRHVLRPQSRRMRPQVDVDRWPAWRDDFQ